MGRKFGWPATFTLLALIFAVAFALGMALLLGILIPAYVWLLTDLWQWTPFNRWLRFVVLGAVVGFIASASITTYTWLTETRTSIARKVVTTMALVVTCVAVAVLAREHLGRLLPG